MTNLINAAFIFFYCLLFIFSPALAVRPDEMLPDPQMEARARSIGQDLRCLVCQNQSIDDSDADLAHDLRVLVRQRIQAGDSDEQVKNYIVARYGDFVLLDPPFKSSTVFLWFAPILLAACGIGGWYVTCRKHRPVRQEDLK